MPNPRRLLRGSITYSQAKGKETNIIHQLTYWQRQNEFFEYIHKYSGLIEALVARHLGLCSSMCRVAGREKWMHGSFNLCVPVLIRNANPVIMRFPLPYRVGDDFSPGNSDEKVRCEAGAYAWLEQECPAIRIPRIYGFGLSSGKCVCLPVTDEGVI
jgi:hypothetical protein